MHKFKNNLFPFALLFIITFLLFSCFCSRVAKAATTNCSCATGNTGLLYYMTFNKIDHTSAAGSEAQCSSDCYISIIPPEGKIVYYEYNSGGWKQAQASCSKLYGGDFACLATNNIKDSSQCKSSCAGGRCCPTSSSLNFIGGANPQQCATGYMCKNILTVPESKRFLCTNGCTAPDIGNGSCCPTSDVSKAPIDTSGGGIENNKIPGVTEGNSEFIKCGRPGQNMCTLCDLIAGLNNIIHYIMRIAVFIGLAAFTAAGVMYVVSFGSKDLTSSAKVLMTNTVKGFVIIFAAWLIINYTIYLLGARNDENGMFGIHVVSWGKFDCNADKSYEVSGYASPSSDNGLKVASAVATTSCQNKNIKAIDIQCENGTTNNIALSTEPTSSKPNSYQLKAFATYECQNGLKQVTEDITSAASWSSINQEVATVTNGNVRAIGAGDTSVEINFQNQNAKVDVFVNTCPLVFNTEQEKQIGKKNILSNLLAFKPSVAVAADCSVCGGLKSVRNQPTCELLAGSKDAHFVFVLARGNLTTTHACAAGISGKNVWSDDDAEQVEAFSEVANKLASGVQYAGLLASNFAVYKSNKIYAGQDTMSSLGPEMDCFWNGKDTQGKKVIAGYLEYGIADNSTRSYSIPGSQAYLCYSDALSDGGKLFAHEMIGHSFAWLNDEYVEPGNVKLNSLINCTKDSTCSKWQSVDGKSLGGCYKGCQYSQSYYRSSDCSIMKDEKNCPQFSALQQYLIKYMIDNYPNQATKLFESK